MSAEVTKFIEAYRDSFGRGASAIADFYAEPCVTARMGVVRVNLTRTDTELLFAEIEATYRSRGFTHADILTMDVQSLGANSALATVQWGYKGACEELLWKTTFTLNLYRRDGVWKILLQTMHDSDTRA
jgi:hypothetical protein